MNKNTRQRRAEALRNFRVNGQASTEFAVPVMRPGGYTMSTTSIRIGFVTPPPKKRKLTPEGAVFAAAADAELKNLTSAADAILGKPKVEPPMKEARPVRPAKPAKPLGKIGL